MIAGLAAGIVTGLVYAIRPDGGAKLYIAFDNVPGLHAGAPVRIGGVRVGTVDAATPQAGSGCDASAEDGVYLLVTARVDKNQLHRIRTGSLAYVTTVSILGENYVEIDIGGQGDAVMEGDRLCGQPGITWTTVSQKAQVALRSVDDTVSLLRSRVESISTELGDTVAVVCSLGFCPKSEKPIQLPTFEPLMAAWNQLRDTLARLVWPEVDLGPAMVRFQKIRSTFGHRADQAVLAFQHMNDHVVADLTGLVSEMSIRGSEMRDNALISMQNMQSNLEFISQRLGDKRYTLGAFSADLEMQNDVKGLQRDLKRYLIRFILAGGDESLPAR